MSTRPSHVAYQVREGGDGKSFFDRVGAAYPHRDGKGYNVLLQSLPIDGRITLRTRLERGREETPQPNKSVEPDRDQ